MINWKFHKIHALYFIDAILFSKSSDVKLEGLWESSSMNHFDEPKSDEKHDFILVSSMLDIVQQSSFILFNSFDAKKNFFYHI